jgi:carotenoid cleavage dioxygenase-like enzyme
MSVGQMAGKEVTTRRGRDRGFLSGAREIDETVLSVRGALPDWLDGTLLLNGPALWELPGGSLAHWFDGYAMLHGLRFERGTVQYRSRFARSDAYRRSIAAGRPVFGEFGSPNPAGLFERLRGTGGTDNPAVVMSRHGGRWLAVTETPILTYFDPHTLETGERIELGSPEEPMHLMAAHGFTLSDGSYLNVGVELGPKCTMKVFTLAPGEKRPRVLARIRTAKAGYTHALALAPGHAIVWECSMRAQPLAFRFGAKSYMDNFRWEPGSGAMLHAVPLSGGPTRSWRIPAMFAFHAAQASRDGDDLVLELSIYDDATIFGDLMLAQRRSGSPIRSVPRLVRYRLRPGAAESAPEPVASAIELPQVHPARAGQGRARVCWGSRIGENGGFSDCIVRVDLDTGSVARWQRPDATHLEPLFVPRPGGAEDDDGVLCVPTLADGDRASVIGIVDARTMQCIAEIDAPQVVPFGFHAAFANA